MLSPQVINCQQVPLIHEVHADDQYSLNTIDGEWFEILHHFHWVDYRHHAATYYDALYAFNIKEQEASISAGEGTSETEKEAKQRLLFDRATMQSTATQLPQVIYKGRAMECPAPHVDPLSLSPGVVPMRLVGRKPKCFFGLLKSFMGTALMGFAAEPEQVQLLLKSNPSFARVCGFSPKEKDKAGYYNHHHVPSLRKLEQFDQVMRQAGIWDRIKVSEVKANLQTGVIKQEKELVGDTTHYHAYSGFETLSYEDDKGNIQKKSQSKTTKGCRCDDWATCLHEWELSDDGAGTVV
jgi:hypothetical protein